MVDAPAIEAAARIGSMRCILVDFDRSLPKLVFGGRGEA